MIFTTIILTKSVQYRLSRWHVTIKTLPEHLTGKHTTTNHYWTKHKVWHKRRRPCTFTLPSMQITMSATSTDQYQQPNSFSIDTDGVYSTINNSANGVICNIKSMFVGDFERHRVTLVTAYGWTTTKKLVGTIHLVLKDDEGKPWLYDIPDVVYDPESPYSLVGIPFLGKYLLEMMKQMNLMNKHGYNSHWHHPFSNRAMANINSILNMETLICQNY
jgi:hypothetical protein